jgi:hypothetical protein
MTSANLAFALLNSTAIAVFGTPITYITGNGQSFAIAGLPVSGARKDGLFPDAQTVLFIQNTDLPQPPRRGDRIKIGNQLYSVFLVKADASETGVYLSLQLDDIVP